MHDTPRVLTAALADAISAGRLEDATSCFSSRAWLMIPDGTTVEGRDPIREILHQMIGMRLRIRAETHRLTYLGDRALLSERWYIRRHLGPPGGAGLQTTRALSLHGRVHHGSWKIIFLAPWGFD